MEPQVAVLSAHFTPKQVQIAAWYYFDGATQREIAGWLRVSQPIVARHILAIETKWKSLGVPPLRRLEHPTRIRRVSNYLVA